MKSIFLIVLGLFVFGISPVFAEEQLELLVSPLIVDSHPNAPYDRFIIRDVTNDVWEMAAIPIKGLDYVEGNAYHIIAKRSAVITYTEHKQYDLIEIKQVFKPHMPYNPSWKHLCAPGYNTWDGVCVFAFRCSEYAWPGKPCTINRTEQDYLRPLQQEKTGVLPEDVICLESLQLVVRHDNTSACVKSSSVDKLLERGFTLVKNNNNSPYD